MKRVTLLFLLLSISTASYSLTINSSYSNLVDCIHGSFWYGCSAKNGSDNINLFEGHDYESTVSITYDMTCDPGFTARSWNSGFSIDYGGFSEKIPYISNGTISINTNGPIYFVLDPKSYFSRFHYSPGCNLSLSVQSKIPSTRLMDEWKSKVSSLTQLIDSKESELKLLEEYIGISKTLQNFTPFVDNLISDKTISDDFISVALEMITCDSVTELNPLCNPLVAVIFDQNGTETQKQAALTFIRILSQIDQDCLEDCNHVELDELQIEILVKLKEISKKDRDSELKLLLKEITRLKTDRSIVQSRIDEYKE